MRKRSYLLLVSFVLFAVSLNAKAQGGNSVSGFVFDESRNPVADVYVELLNEFGSTLTRTKTTGSGMYRFTRLPEGRFKVKVLTYGTNFLSQTKAVSLISVSAIPGSGGISEQLDFYLLTNRSKAGPLAAPGVVFAQRVPKEAEKHYEEGIELLDKNNDKEGFEKLKRSLEIFPEYYLALDRLGTEYVLLGYYRPAFVLLTKALEVNSKSFSSHLGLGIAQFRLEQVGDAVKSLEKAVSIYDESVNAHLWLGISLQEIGKTEGAESALLKANKLSGGKSPDVRWQLARLYTSQKRFAEAADELELYLKYNKEAPNADDIKDTISKLREKADDK